jgi:hypothetical protein
MGDKEEKRLRKAIDDLHRYAENPKNPLNGPAFAELLDELYLAKDAMTEAEELSDPELENQS